MKAALVGLDCTLGPMQLKDPAAQGINRHSVKTWRLIDSFNLVFPTTLREYAAGEFQRYFEYQHSLGDQGDIVKSRDKLWPKERFSRQHYDAYIAIIGVMGIVKLPAITDYWTTNTRRYVVPFVRRVMIRNLWQLARHYAHFNDASKKVQRGDRDQPSPPDGYDPIFKWRPMLERFDGFNKVWPSLVTLSNYLTIDENMIKCAMHWGLSRRQPNKPTRDGPQVYVLSESKGKWVYQVWIDQGEFDPNLRPPYHFGKTVAFILHLLVGAGALGSWSTLIIDQYFTSPLLLIVLFFLKVFCIGTCQITRRAWPATQIFANEKANGKVKKPGEARFWFEVGARGAIKWALACCKWYDKNEVHIACNCETGEEQEYSLKRKGSTDAIDTRQPKMRRLYTDNKVGVDVVDQKDAALISDHGSKKSPWHRVHDSFVNTAMTLALEHFDLVITAFGSEEQRRHLNRLRHDAVEARWELLEQLTEEAHFGVENPNVSTLQRGRAQKNKAAADEEEGGEEDENEYEFAGEEEDAEDGSDDEGEGSAPRPRPEP